MPRAVVVLVPGASADGVDLEILQHVRTTLAGYKCPRQIQVVTVLPRNADGAIDRAALMRG